MISIEEISGKTGCCAAHVLEATVHLAVEIAREGREGRKIGTLFVVGDEVETLKRSTNLILDPLFGHPEASKRICDPDVRETLKELAQLDGAFIVSGKGVVISAARYINASADHIRFPLGLGSRHVAAASISHDTQAVAVVVSESSVVRIYNEGRLVAEIIPEIWLLSRESIKISGPHREQKVADLRIVTAED
jgi:DNA integrity scanning protein DisA with diadenylate cyclase activity